MQRGRGGDHRRAPEEENHAEGRTQAQGESTSGLKLQKEGAVLVTSTCLCLAAGVVDQVLDLSVWIDADLLRSQSPEGLREEACEFDAWKINGWSDCVM